jgi:hypothetical protein
MRDEGRVVKERKYRVRSSQNCDPRRRPWARFGNAGGSLLLAVGVLLGCSPESCWKIERGQTYLFTVRETNLSSVPAPPPPRCGPSLFPDEGETLHFLVTDDRLDDVAGCREARAELVGEHSLTIADRPPRPAAPMGAGRGQTVISASVAIDWDGCPGTWAVLALGLSDGDNALVAYRPGRPEVALYRTFHPDSIYVPSDEALAAACSHRPVCTDSFGVEVTRGRPQK